MTNNSMQWDAPPITFEKKCYICGCTQTFQTSDFSELSAEQIWITIAFRRWFCPDHFPDTPEKERAVQEKEALEEKISEEDALKREEDEDRLYDV